MEMGPIHDALLNGDTEMVDLLHKAGAKRPVFAPFSRLRAPYLMVCLACANVCGTLAWH